MSKLRMYQVYFNIEDWKEFRKHYPKPIASYTLRKLMKEHLEELKKREN